MEINVLVVDDIYSNRFVMEQMLTDFSCDFASNGEEMWRKLESKIPDVIIMDIGLPNENGIELTGKLSKDKRFKDIPVIFLTAHSEPSDVLKAMTAGGDGYLIKPVNENLLIDRINSAIDKKRISRVTRKKE